MISEPKTIAFLDELRAKTTDSHKKLEALSVSTSITNPKISLRDYAHYLGLMRDVIADTETHIFPTLSATIDDIKSRHKLGWIEADLQNIGAMPKDSLTVFAHPQINSVAFALGMMYTVEGSVLGGRYILKNIQSVLGFDEHSGARYFYGYGNKTGQFWKEFLQKLEASAQNPGHQEEIIAGAKYAFDAIHQHFSENPL